MFRRNFSSRRHPRGYSRREILDDYPYTAKSHKRGAWIKWLLLMLFVLVATLAWHSANAADRSDFDRLQAIAELVTADNIRQTRFKL